MAFARDFLCFLIFLTRISDSFLVTPGEDSPEGRCIWYDQCGPGFNPSTFLNCPANNKTRNGVFMKSARGLDILKQLCPNIYKGSNNTRTCCSESQLITLEDSMEIPQQLLTSCPNCLKNFLNFFCQITCGLNQADFIWPDMSHSYPPGYQYKPKGIPAVYVVLTNQYAQGFYNSCKDVSQGRAIMALCGTALNCDALKFLNFMGSTENGKTGFQSGYLLKNHNWTSPDRSTLVPMNDTYIACNDSSNNNTPCACRDCSASCCASPTHALLELYYSTSKTDKFSAQLSEPPFRRSQLVITRPNNHTRVIHSLPPPAPGSVSFTSMFELEFLHEVLDLQTNITTLPVNYKGETFSFTGICYKPAAPENEGCAVESILQYWQNNRTKLDEVIWDEYQIFELADDLDHFLSCTKDPYAEIDTTKLNMSCRAEYGDVMKPINILGGYDGANYQNATTYVISFYLNTTNDDQRAKVEAWYTEVVTYLHTCTTTDMELSFWP